MHVCERERKAAGRRALEQSVHGEEEGVVLRTHSRRAAAGRLGSRRVRRAKPAPAPHRQALPPAPRHHYSREALLLLDVLRLRRRACCVGRKGEEVAKARGVSGGAKRTRAALRCAAERRRSTAACNTRRMQLTRPVILPLLYSTRSKITCCDQDERQNGEAARGHFGARHFRVQSSCALSRLALRRCIVCLWDNV